MTFESDLTKYNQSRSKFKNIKADIENKTFTVYVFGFEKLEFKTLIEAIINSRRLENARRDTTRTFPPLPSI
jgi:hypothetical protein